MWISKMKKVLITKTRVIVILLSVFVFTVMIVYGVTPRTNEQYKPKNMYLYNRSSPIPENKEKKTELNSNNSQTELTTQLNTMNEKITDDVKKPTVTLKYILQWTSAKNVPFVYMGKGQQGFIDRNCPYTNCFVTDDRNYLGGDITKFDVIAFAGPEVIRLYDKSLPKHRSPDQKYAFATLESSDYYPVCSNRFDGYFNWTWTFRLDSEVKWGYITIRDIDRQIVGPKKEMHWIKFEDMDPVSNELKHQLKSKTKAAAWFVSNCFSKSKRESYVKNLEKELKQYNLTVDVYGQCGSFKCPRSDESACFEKIKQNYYFYLSFENSFSEDYVTEKLLTAVQNYAVPIVFGAANYTRFLPDHSYLNARELGVKALAAEINRLIRNVDEYYDYFRWRKYYSYHRKIESVETDTYCLFCAILNNEEKVNEHKVYQHFKEWWDPPNRC